MRRIAVIGAAGRTGRHAVEQALARGHKVIIDTRPLRKARTLTYADLATALLDCLDRPELHRRAAYVAN